MLKEIDRYRERVIFRAITPKTKWNPGELEGGALSVARET